MANISFYGSHNGGIAIEDNGKILCVLEFERFTNYKNVGACVYKTVKDPHIIVNLALEWINKTYGINEFDTCIENASYINMHGTPYDLSKFINAKNFSSCTHHLAHASGVFYQSPYDKALIFSFDGGGDDGKFNVYFADRKNGPVILERIINPKLKNDHIYYDLGFPYATFGDFFEDIRLEPIVDGNLVYPGKIMGLCSYGEVIEEWIPYFKDYYNENAASGEYTQAINDIIGSRIGIQFRRDNRLSGQQAYNVAATAQRAFEECFLDFALPYMNQYPDLPICVTGGCGLNIILNTRLKTEFNREVFVGPNPNDCGIAVGLLLNHLKPTDPVDLTYTGLPILDYSAIGEYLQFGTPQLVRQINYTSEDYPPDSKVLLSEIVSDIVDGSIVGIVRDQSEHGPRALGNRSIICNPSFPNMKDILNYKVKNREWYRPFAPVVRLEDVSKYFEWEGESRWMSFCPKVKLEWREKLAAITHIDGTARVQTVTREQNPFLYELLTEFDNQSGIGVLLNTSFNVAGRPILSTLKDAFEIFNKTNLDKLIVQNLYISK